MNVHKVFFFFCGNWVFMFWELQGTFSYFQKLMLFSSCHRLTGEAIALEVFNLKAVVSKV